MSSILKALKRIEVQSERSDPFFTRPETRGTIPPDDSNARRRWVIPVLITVSLVLLVSAMAAIIVFNRQQPMITKKVPAGVAVKQKKSASSSEKSNIFRAKIPPGATRMTKRPPKKDPLAKNQVKPNEFDGNVKKTLAKARSIGPKGTVDQLASKPTSTIPGSRRGTAATPNKSPQKRSALKDKTTSRKSGAVRSVPSGKPATKAKKPATKMTYDRIDDSKLKLQALAWFNDASKRMAVINSHIVREGGSVDGYQITQIRRQDVVVSDGKKSWRLEFGLKH